MNKIIIEKDKLINNINAIKAEVNNTPTESKPIIIAVLKGNAYGISIPIMADLLIQNGINFFAVTDVYEGQSIRKLGYDCRVLVLNSTCILDEIKIIVENDLIASCGSLESIRLLEEEANRQNKDVYFHLNIDTGMHRFGFRAQELLNTAEVNNQFNSLVETLGSLNRAKLAGIYTHFQQAYEKSQKNTREQFSLFINVLNRFRNKNINYGLAHCANTSAFFKYPEMRLDAVRIGSAFSGRCQPGLGKGLQKVGYLESRICEINNLKAGDKVFYSGMYTCKKDMKVGVVEAGYFEGFDTIGPKDKFKTSNKLYSLKHMFLDLFRDTNNYVVVNNKKVQVLGRIGMKNFVIDLSNVDANVGDKVIISVVLTLCNPIIPRELV